MALFPQQFIDEVRSAADIVTVISDYVSLRKAGAKFKGLCPFHGEKTPSFNVDRDRGFFHCFGCGVGGDVFKFIELQEKVGFTDAVRQLAQRFGIPVPELDASESGRETSAEREALLKMHELAAGYFREQLESPAGLRIREYLLGERGLTPETIATLGLGYAPQSRDTLRQRFLKQGFSPATAVKSGLISRRDDGSEVDRFRNRLMIPITRETGSIIAFGGRALEKDQQPKYLNSPETPIYSKSRTLYGLSHTKGHLRKADVAVIVEGYFDFAQVFQAGGVPVVATCGTALTATQAQLLRRFTSKTVLCYDPDTAGQGAAERSCELLVSEGFSVNVALLPGGQDPDSFVQTRGRDAYVAQLKQSKPYLEFLLDRAATGIDLGRDDARREFLSRMLGVAARIPDPAARDQFADRLAHKARVTEEVVRAEIRKAAAARKTELPAERARSLSAPLRDVERGLLWAIVHTPADAHAVLSALEPTDFEGLRSQDLLEKAASLLNLDAEELPAALMERLNDQEAQLLSRVASETAAPVPILTNCIEVLRSSRIERQLAAIQQEIDDDRLEHRPADLLNQLLRKKNDLRSQLEHTRRGPRDGYNR
ncbi:MAG TPA: DNA primase [Vicinamibacterales bacterium]|nr:DNA primase [Vicinamibacterales bacterium]